MAKVYPIVWEGKSVRELDEWLLGNVRLEATPSVWLSEVCGFGGATRNSFMKRGVRALSVVSFLKLLRGLGVFMVLVSPSGEVFHFGNFGDEWWLGVRRALRSVGLENGNQLKVRKVSTMDWFLKVYPKARWVTLHEMFLKLGFKFMLRRSRAEVVM